MKKRMRNKPKITIVSKEFYKTVVPHKEFADKTFGFTDKPNNRIYVKRAKNDEETINRLIHEMQELYVSKSPHQVDGIRYGWFTDIMEEVGDWTEGTFLPEGVKDTISDIPVLGDAISRGWLGPIVQQFTDEGKEAFTKGTGTAGIMKGLTDLAANVAVGTMIPGALGATGGIWGSGVTLPGMGGGMGSQFLSSLGMPGFGQGGMFASNLGKTKGLKDALGFTSDISNWTQPANNLSFSSGAPSNISNWTTPVNNLSINANTIPSNFLGNANDYATFMQTPSESSGGGGILSNLKDLFLGGNTGTQTGGGGVVNTLRSLITGGNEQGGLLKQLLPTLLKGGMYLGQEAPNMPAYTPSPESQLSSQTYQNLLNNINTQDYFKPIQEYLDMQRGKQTTNLRSLAAQQGNLDSTGYMNQLSDLNQQYDLTGAMALADLQKWGIGQQSDISSQLAQLFTNPQYGADMQRYQTEEEARQQLLQSIFGDLGNIFGTSSNNLGGLEDYIKRIIGG